MESIQQKLERVEQELESLKKEYQDYTYIVSHDLSAHLRSIEGFSAIISKDNASNFDDKTKNHFDYVIKSTESIKEIISVLLNYSRINSNDNVFTEIDCNDLFQELKDQLKEMIAQSEAIISIKDLPQIQGNREQILKLFYHLLQNALLYRKEDVVPQIYITCEDNIDMWKFSIKDNGIGIKDNLKDKIFKPLRRGVSNKKYKGIGMGLSIVQKILKNHGGKIWMESEMDSGSSFFFTIKKNLEN